MQDITIKIEGPIKIETDFNVDFKKYEKDEIDSVEESEHLSYIFQSNKTVDCKFKIDNIFTNQSTSALACFAVTGNHRF